MGHNRFCLSILIASVVLLSWWMPLSYAQQKSDSHEWIVNSGPKLVQIDSGVIHVNQTNPNEITNLAIVSTHISLQSGKPWNISFEVRFGELRTAGVAIGLFADNQVIGWVGSDGWYKATGYFVGKDNEVAAPKTDSEWHHVEFSSDGTILTISDNGHIVGSGLHSGTPNFIKIGDIFDPIPATILIPMAPPVGQQTEIWVRNVRENTDFSNSPSTFPVVDASKFDTVLKIPGPINIQDNDNAVCCVLGDTIHISGTTSGQNRLKRRSLYIDGQPYDDFHANPDDNGYSYDWKPSELGSHHLAVNFVLENPDEFRVLRKVTVKVLPKSPLGLQQFSKPIPSSIPVMVRSLDTTLFHPVRVDFLLNGQTVGTANQEPFQVILPISKQLPGSYDVSYQAYDAEGDRLSGESETISVPLRVKVTMPSSLTLTTPKQIIPFVADIVPDLKITRVIYSLGDQQVATSVTPPYDAKVDLSSFKSGTYPIKAEVSIEDGETFCNPPATINITNQPDDERLAQLAQEEANRQAQLQRDEDEKQARLAKQVADEANAKVAAQIAAKQQEELYEKEIADNTKLAVRQNLVSVALDGNLSKFSNSYLFVLKFINRSAKGVGPIMTEIRFDDFSLGSPLAYDGSLSQSFDTNGFPIKYLNDDYHDLVVPPNATKIFYFYVPIFSNLNSSPKPTRINFLGTLSPLSIPLNP